MTAKYLLDTNVISELTRKSPDASALSWISANQGDTCISSVTVEELEYGVGMLPEGKRKDRLGRDIERLLNWYGERIVAYAEREARLCGAMLAKARKAGNNCSIEDVMIAATAQAHEMVVVTRNVKDFASLGVEILNPFSG